jgi:ATP-dependent DNA helicase RecQ
MPARDSRLKRNEGPVASEVSEYPPNSVVRHEQWRRHTVVHHETDRLMVLFDDVGYKTG